MKANLEILAENIQVQMSPIKESSIESKSNAITVLLYALEFVA